MNTPLLMTVYIGSIPLGFSMYAMRDVLNARQKEGGRVINHFAATEAATWSILCLGLVISLYGICAILQSEYPNDTTISMMGEVIGVFQLWSAFGALAPYFVVPMIFGRSVPSWRAGSSGTENPRRERSKLLFSLLALVCVVALYGGGLCVIMMELRLDRILHK